MLGYEKNISTFIIEPILIRKNRYYGFFIVKIGVFIFANYNLSQVRLLSLYNINNLKPTNQTNNYSQKQTVNNSIQRHTQHTSFIPFYTQQGNNKLL